MSKLTDVIQNPGNAVEEIARLNSRIARLVEAGDRAMEHWVELVSEHGNKFQCTFCESEALPFRSIDEPDNDDNNGWECEHDDDCPVTEWNNVKREGE